MIPEVPSNPQLTLHVKLQYKVSRVLSRPALGTQEYLVKIFPGFHFFRIYLFNFL